jgi:alkanesulfonate monooxygenase SsuD/methylene tetrahydromethanopterin reductase-like flavin-dependent oxidoreductase (luciferase family)
MMPPPDSPIPIYLGALNPMMLQLAGELCDGAIVNMLGESFVPNVVAEVRKGAERANRDPNDFEIVMRLQCAVGEDPKVCEDAFGNTMGAYIIARGYDRFFTWQGYGESVEGVRKAFAARDRAAARAAVQDGLLHDLVIAGDEDTVRARLKAFMNAGIDTPAVHAFWPNPDTAWRTMRACAPQ